MSEEKVTLALDDSGLAIDLPGPEHPRDEVQQVPYRPVQFRDDDLPTALERAAVWLRAAQERVSGAPPSCASGRCRALGARSVES